MAAAPTSRTGAPRVAVSAAEACRSRSAGWAAGGSGRSIVLAIVYFLFIKGGGGGGGFNVPDPSSAFPQVPQSGTGNDSVPGSPSEEKEVQFVDVRPGGRAGLLDAAVPGGRQALPAREGGALPQPGAIRLRARQLRDRAVLLPARPEGLHRPRLLPRAQPALQGPGRLRPGLRDRPRDRPPRPAAARHRAAGSAAEPGEPRTTPTRSRCASSCRPTASPASGRARPTTAASSRAATSRRG